MNIIVDHDKENHQFISEVEGKISHLKYKILPDRKTLDYTHTFVPPELRGREIAGTLVKFALEYAKENHYKVIPSCSFVRSYMDRHHEYENLRAK